MIIWTFSSCRDTDCLKFFISGTMRAVRNRKVSIWLRSWLLEVWCLLRTVRNRERPCRGNVLFFWRLASLGPWELSVMDRCPLSSAEAPAGYPHQNKIIEKIESARGTMGRGKRRASLLSSPFPSCPARSLFLSPQPPHNTKRPLRRREDRCPY